MVTNKINLVTRTGVFLLNQNVQKMCTIIDTLYFDLFSLPNGLQIVCLGTWK